MQEPDVAVPVPPAAVPVAVAGAGPVGANVLRIPMLVVLVVKVELLVACVHKEEVGSRAHSRIAGELVPPAA